MAKTKKIISEALAAVTKAERELENAKRAHREAFRNALARLCNEYRLQLDAGSSEGARLEITDLNRTLKPGDLPE